MRKIKYLIIFFYTTGLYAQIDTTAFYDRVNKSYFNFSTTDLKNVSAWITSDYFNEKMQMTYTDELFPLEIIWSQPDKLFFIKRPLPVVHDSLLQEIDNYQTSLQRELKPLLIDWQRFYGGPLLAELPIDHQFVVKNDTILISFEREETNTKIHITMFFGINGSCQKIINHDIVKDQKIYIYPTYYSTGQKWLCDGWLVQMAEQGEITSGYKVKIESKLIEKIYFPEKFILQLMTTDNTKVTFEREYYFKNIRFNRDLKILN